LKVATLGDAAGANSFDCCLERGEDVDSNIELAVQYYGKATSQSHASGLYNIGRCLKYGSVNEGEPGRGGTGMTTKLANHMDDFLNQKSKGLVILT
jgi:TPR repeat protein